MQKEGVLGGQAPSILRADVDTFEEPCFALRLLFAFNQTPTIRKQAEVAQSSNEVSLDQFEALSQKILVRTPCELRKGPKRTKTHQACVAPFSKNNLNLHEILSADL